MRRTCGLAQLRHQDDAARQRAGVEVAAQALHDDLPLVLIPCVPPNTATPGVATSSRVPLMTVSGTSE